MGGPGPKSPRMREICEKDPDYGNEFAACYCSQCREETERHAREDDTPVTDEEVNRAFAELFGKAKEVKNEQDAASAVLDGLVMDEATAALDALFDKMGV